MRISDWSSDVCSSDLTAPTPTQTAYAVPTGSDFIAMPSRPRLMIIASTVPTVGHNLVKPSVYFSPIAQPISNSPASTRINQFIVVPSSLLHELGFQLHRPEAIDLAVDVVVLVDQANVAYLGPGLERRGSALDLEILGDRHRVAVRKDVADRIAMHARRSEEHQSELPSIM